MFFTLTNKQIIYYLNSIHFFDIDNFNALRKNNTLFDRHCFFDIDNFFDQPKVEILAAMSQMSCYDV